MSRDIYKTLHKFENAKLHSILENPRISTFNKKIIDKWLIKKRDQLRNRKGFERESQLRWSKTILKYVRQVSNVGIWFGNKKLTKLTKKDIIKFYSDFEDGSIKSVLGKPFSRKTKDDYYSKIFKGDFAESIGIREICKKVMIREPAETGEVKFILRDDLDLIVKSTNVLKYKLFFMLSFDLCLRIGETMNLMKSDFEKRYNENTKQHYYKIRIRKEITKSKKERRISTLMKESTNLLDRYLKSLKKDEILFPDSYENYRKMIQRISVKNEVKCQPDNNPVTPHVLRKSGATYWLRRGFSIDQIKARLGHKPSSRVIDAYVSYLGLDEEQSVEEIQTGDINEMTKKYNESQEQKIVQDERLKFLEDKLEMLETDRKLKLQEAVRAVLKEIGKA